MNPYETPPEEAPPPPPQRGAKVDRDEWVAIAGFAFLLWWAWMLG